MFSTHSHTSIIRESNRYFIAIFLVVGNFTLIGYIQLPDSVKDIVVFIAMGFIIPHTLIRGIFPL